MDHRERIESIHRAQAYIEQHLGERISLQQLARAARLSPWHLSRTFKDVTGKSPFEYIRAARLSVAATRLVAEDSRIIDVALDHLFDSHEGFTRAFARRFGMTPSEFRRRRPQAKLFLPPRSRELDLSRTKGRAYMPTASASRSPAANPSTVFVQVVERPPRRLILKRGRQASDYHEYCREVGCEVWDRLGEIEAATHEPMGLWLPESLRPPDTSEYAQGVEVPADFAGPIPDGFEAIDLPACQLMVFQGEPFDDEEFESAISALRAAIRDHDPQTNGYAWADEDAPRFQLVPLGYRGYIEGRPVRPLT